VTHNNYSKCGKLSENVLSVAADTSISDEKTSSK